MTPCDLRELSESSGRINGVHRAIFLVMADLVEAVTEEDWDAISAALSDLESL